MTTPSVPIMVAAFLGGAVVTFAVTPLVARLAAWRGAFDRPGDRKVHAKPTPRLGGVAVFAGLLVGSVTYGFVRGWDSFFGLFSSEHHLSLLAPCLIVFAVGVVEDVRGLAPAARVVIEAIAAMFLIQAGFVIDSVWIPWGDPIQLTWFRAR